MPIIGTDLNCFASLNRPEDDTTVSGGAVDRDNETTFTELAANDTLELVSNNAGDTTQNVTVTGRDNTGAVISDTKQVDGTNIVNFVGTFERILKVLMDADAVGNVEVRRTGDVATVGTIPAGQRGFTRMFINAASNTSPVTRYEKKCWANDHATLTLGDAVVTLTSDPADRIRIGLDTTKDSSSSVANRLTAPAGVTFVDNAVAVSIPGNQLEAGSYIGCWVEQALLANDAAFKNRFNTQLLGTTI